MCMYIYICLFMYSMDALVSECMCICMYVYLCTYVFSECSSEYVCMYFPCVCKCVLYTHTHEGFYVCMYVCMYVCIGVSLDT